MDEEYRQLLQEIRDTYFLLQNETVVFASDHSLELLGYSPDELIGKSMWDLLAGDQLDWLYGLHRDRLEGKPVSQRYESSILKKDGVLIPVEITAWLTRYHGEPAVAGIATDITERKQAEDALRESEAMYATLFEHSPISLWEEDWSAVKAYMDNLRYSGVQNLKQYFNEHPDEISLCFSLIKLGKPNYAAGRTMFSDNMKTFSDQIRNSMMAEPVRFFPQETWNEMLEAMIEITEGRKLLEKVIISRTPQGDYVSNLVKLSIAPGHEKTLQRVIVSAMDISECKQAEENYRQLLEDINDGYGVIQDGRYVFVNRRLGEIFGYEPEKILGGSIDQWMLPEDRQARMQEYEQVMLGKQLPYERYEGEMVRGDGKKIVVESSIKAFYYQGKPAFSIIFRDITERRSIEGLLRESRERFQAMIESTSDWIWEVNTKGIYTYSSPKVKDLLGYAPEEVVGKSPFDLMPPEEAKSVINNFQAIMGSQKPFESLENKNRHRDGRLVILETSGVPFFDDTGRLLGYRGIDREITDRKQAEERLREAYEMLRLMFECAPYGVIITDSNMNIYQANENMVNLLGVESEDQIKGGNWLDFIPEHRSKRAKQYFNRLINSDSVMDIEHSVLRPDGSKIIAATSFGMLRDSAGNLLGLIAITRDITLERRLKENGQFYITETIKSSENERKRLARVLHDDTIQEIMFATYRLKDVITGNYGSLPESACSNLEEIQLLLKRIVAEVRRFTTNLRPDILDDMGLVPALEWLADRLRDDSGVETRLKILGEERRLSSEIELTLFRIVQEALNNVRKHAGASLVNVSLNFAEKRVAMSVSDNGGGFELPDNISHYARQQKLGLIGIAERVHLIGGKYEVKSYPRQGTTIMIEVSS